MTFKTLLTKITSEKILKRLLKLYPDQKKNIRGYENVLKELKGLKEHSEVMRILIEKNYDKYDKKYYLHVCAIDKNKKTYAIEFEPWENWLGMKIHPTTFKICSQLDIVCHCLWEMTFTGFTNEDVKKEGKKLFDLCKTAKKEKLLTQEEVFGNKNKKEKNVRKS